VAAGRSASLVARKMPIKRSLGAQRRRLMGSGVLAPHERRQPCGYSFCSSFSLCWQLAAGFGALSRCLLGLVARGPHSAGGGDYCWRPAISPVVDGDAARIARFELLRIRCSALARTASRAEERLRLDRTGAEEHLDGVLALVR